MRKAYAVTQFSTLGEAVAVFESEEDALYFARRLNGALDEGGGGEDPAKHVYEVPLIPADASR